MGKSLKKLAKKLDKSRADNRFSVVFSIFRVRILQSVKLFGGKSIGKEHLSVECDCIRSPAFCTGRTQRRIQHAPPIASVGASDIHAQRQILIGGKGIRAITAHRRTLIAEMHTRIVG